MSRHGQAPSVLSRAGARAAARRLRSDPARESAWLGPKAAEAAGLWENRRVRVTEQGSTEKEREGNLGWGILTSEVLWACTSSILLANPPSPRLDGQADPSLGHPDFTAHTPISSFVGPLPRGLQGWTGGSLGSVELQRPGEAAQRTMLAMSGLPSALFLSSISITSSLRR